VFGQSDLIFDVGCRLFGPHVQRSVRVRMGLVGGRRDNVGGGPEGCYLNLVHLLGETKAPFQFHFPKLPPPAPPLVFLLFLAKIWPQSCRQRTPAGPEDDRAVVVGSIRPQSRQGHMPLPFRFVLVHPEGGIVPTRTSSHRGGGRLIVLQHQPV